MNLPLLFTFAYTVMIQNICDNIPWEIENIKFIGLVGPMGKMGCLSTLVLWVWGFPYHMFVTPLVDLWSFIFYLVLAPLLCVVPWPPLVWWLNLINFYCFIVTWPYELWDPTVSVLKFILCFIMVTTLKPRVS